MEIDQGRIVAREPEKLPVKGAGLLMILPAATTTDTPARPFGLARGEFVVPADFNAPLLNELLREFEGGGTFCSIRATFSGSSPAIRPCRNEYGSRLKTHRTKCS